jgi:hypothetical protein
MKRVNASRKEVRKFGLTFSILSLVVAAFLYYKGDNLWIVFLGGSAFFLLTGCFVYATLKPIYVGWMALAYVPGWVNAPPILRLVFCLIFTPIGLLLRLFGKSLLGLRFDKRAVTYWVKPESTRFDPKHVEQQFWHPRKVLNSGALLSGVSVFTLAEPR